MYISKKKKIQSRALQDPPEKSRFDLEKYLFKQRVQFRRNVCGSLRTKRSMSAYMSLSFTFPVLLMHENSSHLLSVYGSTFSTISFNFESLSRARPFAIIKKPTLARVSQETCSDHPLFQTSRCRLKSQCPSVTSHQIWIPPSSIPRSTQVMVTAHSTKLLYDTFSLSTLLSENRVILQFFNRREKEKRGAADGSRVPFERLNRTKACFDNTESCGI